MCLLSYFEPGVMPDPERLTNGAVINTDGYGWAVVSNDGRDIEVGHGLAAVRTITRFLEARERNPNGPAIFHSRMSTGGSQDKFNCHPFRVGGDPQTVLAHNGVLFSPPKHERRSDTRIFAEWTMPKKYRKLDKPGVRRQLQSQVGPYNKIVILTVNPRYKRNAYIFGGTWHEPFAGEWHSNRDHGDDIWRRAEHWYDEDDQGKWDKYPRRLVPGKNECELCLAKFSVDPDTLICAFCKSCSICGRFVENCYCWKREEEEEEAELTYVSNKYVAHATETNRAKKYADEEWLGWDDYDDYAGRPENV